MSTPADWFCENYIVILDEPLTGPIVSLPVDAEQRRCRFCKQSSQSVTFRNLAHAVPALLGNKAIVSPNECDHCNSRFGRDYENDLGAGTLFERSVTGVPGKRGKPTYAESSDLRIEWDGRRQKITITSKELFSSVSNTGELRLKDYALKAYSQPFVPGNAAKALVKAACSLCPPSAVEQIQPTIAWLMDSKVSALNSFPVFHCFAHGDNPYGAGRALILVRTGSQPIPFMWCIIASGHDRFQYTIPFTTEDRHWIASRFTGCHSEMSGSGTWQYQTFHYPNWTDSTKVEYDQWNWSSNKRTRRSYDVTMNVVGQVECGA